MAYGLIGMGLSNKGHGELDTAKGDIVQWLKEKIFLKIIFDNMLGGYLKPAFEVAQLCYVLKQKMTFTKKIIQFRLQPNVFFSDSFILFENKVTGIPFSIDTRPLF